MNRTTHAMMTALILLMLTLVVPAQQYYPGGGGGGDVSESGSNTFTGTNIFTNGLQAYQDNHAANVTGVMIGDSAGLADVSDSINIGYFAGGGGPGAGTPTGFQNVRLGRHAGFSHTGDQSIIIGHAAGQYAFNHNNAVVIGWLAARNGSQNASVQGGGSVVIGVSAAENATSHQASVLLGDHAGQNCTNAIGTVAIGAYAGGTGPNCRQSVLLGYTAGRNLSRNNTLVIETEDTLAPIGTGGLIYGEFDTRLVKINGSLWMGTMPAKATCDSTKRGAIWFVPGGAGVADTFEICSKDASDAYAWRTLQ